MSWLTQSNIPQRISSIYLSQLKTLTLIGLMGIFSATAGCSVYDSGSKSIVSIMTPYRIKIVQGNVITKQMVSQLSLGMSQKDVIKVLGTPLLTDIFHANRWDYVFSVRAADSDLVKRRVFTVFFDKDSLVKMQGESDLPNESDLIAEMDGERVPTDPSLQGKAPPNPRAFPSQ